MNILYKFIQLLFHLFQIDGWLPLGSGLYLGLFLKGGKETAF